MISFLGLDAFSGRVFALWGAALAATIAAILWTCHGTFLFTLDDPYIHLAVAHNLLLGTYGVNLGEASSPSSSIVWPWMLAATEFLGLGAFGPLLLNVAAAAASVLTGLSLLRRVGIIDPLAAPVQAYVVAAALIFGASAIALPLTGLEHSWHVMMVLLTLEGLVRAADGEPPRDRFLLALFLMPLIRFEGLAFAAAAIVALAYLGYRGQALGTAAAITTAFAIYEISMAWRGLPLLPSSVLLKSGAASSLGHGMPAMAAAIRAKLASDLHENRAIVLALSAGFLAFVAYRLRRERRRLAIYIPIIVAIAAHLAGGAYGWFARYEVYVVALALLGVLLGLNAFRRPSARSPLFVVGVTVVVAIFVWPYIGATIKTPAAAANVYYQQYQIRRFAQAFYQRPVAVNDLGLVSWGNTNYVLDLWGLGSEPVRKLRQARAFGASEMSGLADQHQVGLAMIYEKWFAGVVPRNWSKLANLHTPQVISDGADVAFFLTPSGDRRAALEALARFGQSLPAEDQLQIFADGG